MFIVGDELIFSTGKRVYANLGIVGISPDGEVAEGYDGNIDLPEDKYATNKLNNQECVELADYMIAQWQAFKSKYDK